MEIDTLIIASPVLLNWEITDRRKREMTLYRAAVIGCGRIGSTIDDEQVNKPQFRYP